MKRKLLTFACTCFLGLSLVACSGSKEKAGVETKAGGTETVKNEEKNASKEDASQSSDAKGSGELVVYSPNSDSEIAAVIPQFEEKTGIKVIIQSMGTGDVLARLEAEKDNP